MPQLTIDDSVRSVVKLVETRLREAGIESARAEAEWLLAESLGLRRTELYLCEESVNPQQLESLLGLLERRLRGEPLQYLLGSSEFFGYRLAVNPAVFIPRPETEVLAECAIHYLSGLVRRGNRLPRVLDLGTGSGNLAITLAKAVPTCVVVGVELSWEALQVARSNVSGHQVNDRVWLIQADWTSGIGPPAPHQFVGAGFEFIIANPPYVMTREVQWLRAAGIGDPRQSLDGGPDGLSLHRRLLDDIPRLLAPGGAVVVECAEAQADTLLRFIRAQSWARDVRIVEDLAGRPRGLFIERA